MKYFKWFATFIMFIGVLGSAIFASFLFISGIKMVYSELQLITKTLVDGIFLIIVGGGILIFYYQMIKDIILNND